MAITTAKTSVSNDYDLFYRYKLTGDKAVRDKIVENNLYIAEILAHRFINRGIDYDDIYQVACMGIVYAVERFDPDKNVRFATYATPTVMGEIRHYFRDKGNIIRIPKKLYDIFYKAECIKRHRNESDRSEISRILNISDDMLERAYKAGNYAFIESLENEAFADGKLSAANTVGYDDNSFLMIENSDFIEHCMKNLAENEREFIKLRFYDEMKQSDIAKKMNISQMSVSRLERSVLEKLKVMYFRD